MRTTIRVLALVGVAGVTIVAGTLHGRMTLRWGFRPDMNAAAELLSQIPQQAGDWRAESVQTMSPDTIKMLRCAGYVSRRYVNQRSGEAVVLGIVYGVPGSIAEHTPEVCLSSREFTQRGRRRTTKLNMTGTPSGPIADSRFWLADFQSNHAGIRGVRTYWAWSTGSVWLAPDSPKTTFAGASHLYKIQLSTDSLAEEGNAVAEAPDDSCGRFLREFLPVAERYLVADPAGPVRKPDTKP